MNGYYIDGVDDLGGLEIEEFDGLSSKFLKVCSKEGFSQVSTPNFEDYDLYENLTKLDRKKMVKTIDKDGRVLVMRPDATIPIAKMCATKYENPDQVLKFSYVSTIFREYRSRQNYGKDFIQAGVELFGCDSDKCDAQIIGLALKIVNSFNFGCIQLDLGNVAYLNGLLNETNLSEDERGRIRTLVERKNPQDLKDYIDRVELSDEERNVIISLPKIFGDSDASLAMAKQYALNPQMEQAVNRLESVVNIIRGMGFSERITVDFAFTSQMNYYTDMVFQIYAGSTHAKLVNGGRYNNLAKQFGVGRPACGFGMNLNLIQEYMDGECVEDVIHIALAKGRVEKETMKYLVQNGIEFPEYVDGSRKLLFKDKDEKIEIILVKSQDVPVYVESGVADLGIVGTDVLYEGKFDVYELMKLKIGKCHMATAGFKGASIDSKKKLIVGSKYPNIAKKYFDEKGILTNIIKLNGSVELAPIVGLSDIIVDIVESGKTLKENGLEVIEKFMAVESRLICNKVSRKTKDQGMNKVIKIIQSLEED